MAQGACKGTSLRVRDRESGWRAAGCDDERSFHSIQKTVYTNVSTDKYDSELMKETIEPRLDASSVSGRLSMPGIAPRTQRQQIHSLRTPVGREQRRTSPSRTVPEGDLS